MPLDAQALGFEEFPEECQRVVCDMASQGFAILASGERFDPSSKNFSERMRMYCWGANLRPPKKRTATRPDNWMLQETHGKQAPAKE